MTKSHIKQISLLEEIERQCPQNDITRHSKKRIVFTAGHSNVSIDQLIERLRSYEIDRVIDARTKPYSRWCPWFNRNQLEYSLASADMNYDWRGDAIGGIGVNVGYEQTIQWIYERAAYENIVLLCAEANYRKCHRYLLLTPDLEKLGAEMVHISYN